MDALTYDTLHPAIVLGFCLLAYICIGLLTQREMERSYAHLSYARQQKVWCSTHQLTHAGCYADKPTHTRYYWLISSLVWPLLAVVLGAKQLKRLTRRIHTYLSTEVS